MDFVGRKQNCERETSVENSEKELVSQQADSECNVSLLDEQKGYNRRDVWAFAACGFNQKTLKKSISNEALSMELSTGALKQRMPPVNRQIEYEPQITDCTDCNDQQDGWHYVSHE